MIILAVDYGDARTGLAVCDKTEMLARPAGVIHQWNMDKTAEEVVQAAKENNAQRIIVGNPLNMNGSAGDRSQLCHDFADKLRAL